MQFLLEISESQLPSYAGLGGGQSAGKVRNVSGKQHAVGPGCHPVKNSTTGSMQKHFSCNSSDNEEVVFYEVLQIPGTT